jgi:hypothetical protein
MDISHVKKSLLAMGLVLFGLLGAGCGESVPENTKPADGSNSRVSGSPEERIAAIEANSMLTPEEKAQRIKVIKERNNLK